jgi:hypothetical protein
MQLINFIIGYLILRDESILVTHNKFAVKSDKLNLNIYIFKDD